MRNNNQTPKEKANELVQEYVINMPLPFHIEDARICALIAVDELIKATTPLTSTYYWQEVRQEIEKL